MTAVKSGVTQTTFFFIPVMPHTALVFLFSVSFYRLTNLSKPHHFIDLMKMNILTVYWILAQAVETIVLVRYRMIYYIRYIFSHSPSPAAACPPRFSVFTRLLLRSSSSWNMGRARRGSMPTMNMNIQVAVTIATDQIDKSVANPVRFESARREERTDKKTEAMHLLKSLHERASILTILMNQL